MARRKREKVVEQKMPCKYCQEHGVIMTHVPNSSLNRVMQCNLCGGKGYICLETRTLTTSAKQPNK